MSDPSEVQPMPSEDAPGTGRPPAATDEQPAGERPTPDPVLLAARAQARSALEEITPTATIGADDGHEVHEERVVTMFFECRLPGYPGWRWSATLTRVDDDAPVTVVEVELRPGSGAVVAPEWMPWSERLARYRDAQTGLGGEEAEAARAADELADEDDADAEDDLLENDFSDFDDELDGVDIDAVDDEDDDDLDDDDEDDEDDDDELGTDGAGAEAV